MISKRILLLSLPLVFLLALSHAKTSGGSGAQHLFQRTDGDARPNIEFAASPDAAPVLVKSQYNQFAATPGRDADAYEPAHREPKERKEHKEYEEHRHGRKKEHGDGKKVSEKSLLRWMHRLGLHPNKHQVERLSGLIDGKQDRGHRKHPQEGQHHHKHHQNGQHHEGQKHTDQHHHDKHYHDNHNQSNDHPAAEKGSNPPPAWTEPNAPKQSSNPLPPSHNIGVLPPGTKPLGWGDEASPPPTSPASAAVAPLPEPVNPAPARTASSSSSPSTPLPGGALLPPTRENDAPVTSLPNTSLPSPSVSNGTSGSLNPTSTASSASGDKRLAPLAANSTGQAFGIPTADDGDSKSVQPKTTGKTSGATSEATGWTTSALVAGVTTVVVFLLVAV